MRSSYLFPSLFSLPLSPLPCLANLNSDHRPAPPFVPSSGRSKDPRKPKLRKKGRKKEKSGERGRGRAFQRVFRMKSRPNEVRKLPNGEASSLLLVGSKWRGKKCRLAVAFVATGEWRTRGELRAVNRVAPSLLLTSELDGSGWFVELGIVFRLTSSFLNFNSRRVSLIIIIIRRGKTVGNIILLEAIIWEKIPQKSMRIGFKVNLYMFLAADYLFFEGESCKQNGRRSASANVYLPGVLYRICLLFGFEGSLKKYRVIKSALGRKRDREI